MNNQLFTIYVLALTVYCVTATHQEANPQNNNFEQTREIEYDEEYDK